MKVTTHFGRWQNHCHHCCLMLFLLLGAGPAWSQTPELPARTDDNLIVAFYNIQWIGEKPHGVTKLAEIIQHFDVCGSST
jgi:hypothetical protein